MKKVILLFALAIMPVLFSCSNDDDAEPCCPTITSYTATGISYVLNGKTYTVYDITLQKCGGGTETQTNVGFTFEPVIGSSYCLE